MILFLRATIFNMLFFTLNALICVLAVPALLLPRKQTMSVIRFYLGLMEWLERYVLGLKYEIKGIENLPAEGPYIVAAKHQSLYETFKLHTLFDDPAIVLKKELLNIPIWGTFLSRINPIAIDRSSGKKAMQQVIDGAQRIKKDNRTLVIFPQGTRVTPDQTSKQKPYKAGIARIYDATKMPVVPLALNSGLYWPKKGWMRYPGTVTFEFLPAITEPLSVEDFLETLQNKLESRSNGLCLEAQKTYAYLPVKENTDA